MFVVGRRLLPLLAEEERGTRDARSGAPTSLWCWRRWLLGVRGADDDRGNRQADVKSSLHFEFLQAT
jgi:hypothetical protein